MHTKNYNVCTNIKEKVRKQALKGKILHENTFEKRKNICITKCSQENCVTELA